MRGRTRASYHIITMATQEVYTELVPGSCNCVACGEVIKVKDGRNLSTSASNHLVSLWKDTIAEELARVNQVANLDLVLRERAGRICRKCFLAYERVMKAKTVVAENAANAVHTVVAVAAALKETESDSDEVIDSKEETAYIMFGLQGESDTTTSFFILNIFAI